MRHIALLSAICISVSASVLTLPSPSSAAPQNLKERLEAARLEAARDTTTLLTAPPPITAAAPVAITETTEKTSAPVMQASDATDIKADKSTKVEPVTSEKTITADTAKTKPKTKAGAITWHESVEQVSVQNDMTQEDKAQSNKAQSNKAQGNKAQEKAPVVKVMASAATATTPAAQQMTSEQVIPNTKLQPVILPNALIPVIPVAHDATPQTPQATKPATKETAPAITTVATTEKTAQQASVASDIQAETAPEKADTKASEKPAVKTVAKTKPVKAEAVKAAKTTRSGTASDTVTVHNTVKNSADQALLPMPDTIRTAQPKQVNVVTKPAIPAHDIPAVPVIPDMTKRVVTHVPASTPKGSWSTRLVGSTADKDTAFCLMENTFSNQTSLMIGQRSDGYSTIGINYGVDMLDLGRNYSTLVMVDEQFEENFNGYAESGKMLIVQLGKKSSFFAQLANAQSLQIMLQGVASNFATQGISPALQEFSTCLTSIGGALPEQAPAPMLAQGQNMPFIPVGAVESNDLTPPPIARPDMTAYAATAAAPVTASTVTSNPTQAVTVSNNWSGYVQKILADANIRPKDIRHNAGVTEWSDAHGMHGQVWQLPGADLLEASMTQLDNAEKECRGEFTNQIGTPEIIKGHNIQLMESKCASSSGVSVSTWLIQHPPAGAITAWEMRAPQTQNITSFEVRQKILSAIQMQPNS